MGQSVHQGFSASLLAQESFRPILGNLLKGAKRLLSPVFSPFLPRVFWSVFNSSTGISLPCYPHYQTRRRDLRHSHAAAVFAHSQSQAVNELCNCLFAQTGLNYELNYKCGRMGRMGIFVIRGGSTTRSFFYKGCWIFLTSLIP